MVGRVFEQQSSGINRSRVDPGLNYCILGLSRLVSSTKSRWLINSDTLTVNRKSKVL